MTHYYHHKKPELLKTASDILKLSKDRPKSPSVESKDYQGLAAFDASLYENQHRHSGFKQQLHSLNKPVVEVRTAKVSEYNQAPIVSGISLSPEQLINYNNSEYR